ncbi:MAG: hypothetical protein IIA67_08520, partial [Planctomycetes bacterium]|nr:hypothetical protein [Planctomycetota bacterium]
AIIEAALERLMTAKFVWSDSNLVGQLFLSRGPLADFHSKILVAQAFGVITSNMAQELHSLKIIRNTFAHAKIPLDFDHKLVAQEVASMRMFKAITDVENEARQKLELNNKNWFLLTTKILLIMFAEIQERRGNADDRRQVRGLHRREADRLQVRRP